MAPLPTPIAEQLLIASVEASEQLDSHWLNDSGSAKQGLSTQDKQQVRLRIRRALHTS